MKHELKISKVSIIIIFIALVRTLSEPFRLQYYSATNLPFETVKPFLLAALITAIGLFGMVILAFYKKHVLVSILALAIIVFMLLVKYSYSL